MQASRHRTEAILTAKRLVEAGALLLDTETTGLDERDEIVEICILNQDGQPLVDTLVRPTRPIPPEAIRLHGITNAAVREAPTWEEVWPEVRSALAGRTVGVYNADFDLRMMRQSNRPYRIEWDPGLVTTECLMRLYARFRGEWNSRHQDFRWHSLEEAALRCRIPLPTLHRARADALLARDLLIHMALSPLSGDAPDPYSP